MTDQLVHLNAPTGPQAQGAGQRLGHRLVRFARGRSVDRGNGTPAIWEQTAFGGQSLGVRTVLLRTGLVLDHNGGMLARLLLPFKLGSGAGWAMGAM
jgi:hypothetical protein